MIQKRIEDEIVPIEEYDINRDEKNVIFASGLWSNFCLIFHFGVPLLVASLYPSLFEELDGKNDLSDASFVFILFFYFSHFSAVFGCLIVAFYTFKFFSLRFLF